MDIKSIAIATITLVLSTSVNASLVGRDFDGNLATAEAYYDDVANLTWLADANAAGTTMTWVEANAWVAGLDVAGVNGWRLPGTLQPDASCDYQSGSNSFGYDCSGSEMGNLFYNVLGNVASQLISTRNTGPFNNVRDYVYWSATEYASDNANAWRFDMGSGYQADLYKTVSLYAWAVQSGDVGTSIVPVPATIWLFGSGFIGLIGVARRKKA